MFLYCLWSTRVLEIDQSILATMDIGAPLQDNTFPNGYVITDKTKTCYVSNGGCRELSRNGVAANNLFENFFIEVSKEVMQGLIELDPLTTRELHILSGK